MGKTMQKLCKHLAAALAAPCIIAQPLAAAIPAAWTNTPGMPPYPLPPYPHGVPVDFAVTLRGYSDPPAAPGADVRLWYQTNGMGAAWWSAPATLEGDVIKASFTPDCDTGADRVSLFFGAPSNVFASAVLRLTHSPGFAPSMLPLPVQALDFAAVELRNIFALTNGWSFGAPAPGNYATVSNRAMNAVTTNAQGVILASVTVGDGLAVGEGATAYSEQGSGAFAHGYLSAATAYDAHAEGSRARAEAEASHAEGVRTTAGGELASHAAGVRAHALHNASFVWQGTDRAYGEYETLPEYFSHGKGTFNLNPAGGLAGLYIGDANLSGILDERRGLTNLVVYAADLKAPWYDNNNPDYSPLVWNEDAKGWVFSSTTDAGTISVRLSYAGGVWSLRTTFIDGTTSKTDTVEAPEDATKLTFAYDVVLTRTIPVVATADMLARRSDIPDAPDLSGYATLYSVAAVSNLAATAAGDAATALRVVLGETAWFAVTNYMRTAEGVSPSLQLWEVRDGATNLVYDSREEVTNTVRQAAAELRADMTNRIEAVRKDIPSRAWGRYQSGGVDNPQPGEVAIVNEPTVILTGGGAFNRYLTVGDSSVWALKASGPVAFGGGTNGNFFAVLDDEGKEHFRVAKTDSYDLPAIFSDVLPRRSDNSILLYVAHTNSLGNAVAAPPVLSACDNLRESVWHAEENGEVDALGLTVTWTKDETIPAWVARVTPDAWPPRLFFRAKVVQEGGVAVINTAPARFDGGIQLDGRVYRIVPYTNAGKTYLVLE